MAGARKPQLRAAKVEARIFSFFLKFCNFALKDFWFNYKEIVHFQTRLYAAFFAHPVHCALHKTRYNTLLSLIWMTFNDI